MKSLPTPSSTSTPLRLSSPIIHRFARHFCAVLLGFTALGATAQVVQTNSFSENSTIPGGLTLSSTDLLQTNLASVSRTGAAGSGNTYFYREDSGYTVTLSRLSDGTLGSFGSSGLGGDGNYTVMPNNVTITFAFDTSINTNGYSLSAIRTFASWDTGRDGQSYTVKYATVSDPTNYLTLHSLTAYNPTSSSNTITAVELTASLGSLATNVASLQFVFSGFENGGTAYREFDVIGSATAAIPEPSTYAAILGALALAGTAILRRRQAT